MDFSPNKTPIELIKKGAFGCTYFRDIYYGINEKWYKIHERNVFSQKILMLGFMHQIIMM